MFMKTMKFQICMISIKDQNLRAILNLLVLPEVEFVPPIVAVRLKLLFEAAALVAVTVTPTKAPD